ncbi:tRNA uracil 4-sulfurtransferase ThiI [Bermanella sp. WJH001]|uniref:tRNA uracil 4-sulfurtransferase ThiI n=1 Tax=Bermanella sp. WJH001 TaxID=3048005 RepID=UPI0024BDB80E|nr:tRNA uracil 4-sulfurtransferase ThiI [Bermanella sp. WJH001]MDJ1537028.1 tRNA uracil 4-sulfurtransferase ThiI [Bermanella sp. WJH001]
MKFVIKLFPEITIKSKPVRKRFIVQLRRNIKDTLKHFDIDAHVQGQWDSIEIVIQDDSLEMEVRKYLKRIPGIAKILTVKEHNFETFDDIFAIAKSIYAEEIKGKTFCVRIKRTGQHDFKSVDAERYVGGGLMQHCEAKAVDLKNPEYTVQMEIRGQRLHTISAVDKGLGGYPMGCLDGVLSLVSGGFDSNIASYLMSRRGLQTHFLFFNLGGSAHEIGVKQVAHYLWETYAVSHGVKFVTVPFEGVVSEILEKVDNSQMGVILKRMMLRAGSHVAKELNIDAMVTGESIAQVSSQTLRNLTVIDSVTDTLVLRPLIAMDKPDIIDLSREIGVYDFAASMPEYCGVISVKPTTRAKPEKIEAEENNFDFSVLDDAIANAQIEKIQNVLRSSEGVTEVDLVKVPAANDLVVDIRHPQEEESSPLHLTNNEIIKLPFYQLLTNIDQLPKDRNILLYCAKGTMSQLHAEQLKQNGLENVKVFKP